MSPNTPPKTVEVRHDSVRCKVGDIIVVTQRNLTRYVRVPTLLVFSTIQPVMFVLLFRYVFGGAITPGGGIPYVDYLMPGVFGQVVVFGSTQTGVGLAQDLTYGMVDRFRSLPMARSAVLAGRTISDAARNLFVVSLMFLVGSAIGFRIHTNPLSAAAAMLLAVLFGHAFSWISAFIGLSVRDVESTQAASFVWIFPLVFASSAFVPVASMPGWLQAWANINPVSLTVDAMRGLLVAGPVTVPLLKSLAWIAALLLIFVTASVRRYRTVS